MEQYLKTFFDRIDGEVFFYPSEQGEIELQPIGGGVSILKIYFRNLRSPRQLHNAFDNPIEVMLTNFQIACSDLKDLDGARIEIKNGWTDTGNFTMLSMNNGRAIDNNRVHLIMNNDGSFNVNWFGHYREYDGTWKEKDDVVLHLKAIPVKGIITPLCSSYEGCAKPQHLKVHFPESGDKVYYPGQSSEIQLKELTSELAILRVHFRSLALHDTDEDFYENSTSVMLANYPVSFKSLDELDGVTLEIKEGWGDKALYTMLSIYDGVPINNNKINFRKNGNGSFTVNWTGCWGEDNYGDDDLFLEMVVYPNEDVVTPLCLYDEELIKAFGKPD